MASIYDAVASKEIAAYWTITANERTPFFGESKFPSNKKLGLDLSWIKGAGKSPISLQLSAFDAAVNPLSRQGFDKLNTEMPLFRNSFDILEKQRQELLNVMDSGNQMMIDIIINRIYDDQMHLLENADIAREIMRMQVLTTGVLSLANNGQTYTYDYGVPVGNKVTPTIKWDLLATSDPVADITLWQDKIENSSGVRPTEILLNNVTFNLIKKSDSVKNAIYVFGDGKVTPNSTKVKEFILNETSCTVYVYNKGYVNDSSVFTKFVADGTVVLMPESNLGNTWFGTTPEEADLMFSNAKNVTIVDTGVAITSLVSNQVPVKSSTVASMICLPSFELAEQIIISTVI